MTVETQLGRAIPDDFADLFSQARLDRMREVQGKQGRPLRAMQRWRAFVVSGLQRHRLESVRFLWGNRQDQCQRYGSFVPVHGVSQQGSCGLQAMS